MAKLILLPGLDGTGDLFRPFVEALAACPTQVVTYPVDRVLRFVRRHGAKC